jgi:hypothetical protein
MGLLKEDFIMSDKTKQGFWQSLSPVERGQIMSLLKMLGIIVIMMIIAAFAIGGLVSIFG